MKLPVLFASLFPLVQFAAGPQPVNAPDTYAKIPIYFVENRGQLDQQVAFYLQGRDTRAYFTSDGVTFAVDEPGGRWVTKLEFVDANPNTRPAGRHATPAVVSYFKGAAADWRTGLSTYGSIVYENLWPGIDLIYRGAVNRLKYEFVVKPGADPGWIRLAYHGAQVSVSGMGALEISTPAGSLRDGRPYAYQETGGGRVEVEAAYAVEGGTQDVGFQLAGYDNALPLIIDPAVIVYSGLLGGSGDDDSRAIAVDDSGNVYIAGGTTSTEIDFPTEAGPDLTANGGADAFVAKVNAAGTALLYAGFIGGAGEDRANDIAVDSQGNAYICGSTSSSETSFPVKTGPDLTYNGGASDAFVAKLNSAGTGLTYSGYIGGDGDDVASGIAVDGSGRAFVGGTTSSNEMSFPVQTGPDLTYNGGTADAFVAKVNTAGTGLIYAGYVGGSERDSGADIALDGASSVYIGGQTASDESSFPVKIGPDLTFNGNSDKYVAKVHVAGTELVYAGYIGGSGGGWITGLAVDAAGSLYVSGATTSDESSFPVHVGPDLTHGGDLDGFIAKVNASGAALDYAGYFGGAARDVATGVAVDRDGNAYVCGHAWSDETSFPVKGGPDLTFNGGGPDGFVAKVKADGTDVVYTSYVGGLGDDRAWGIAVDRYGNAYVTGRTDSPDFPQTGDGQYGGGNDAFVAKIAAGPVVSEVLNAAGLVPAGLAGSGIAQGAMFAVKGLNLGPEQLVGPVNPPLLTAMQGSSIEVTVQGVKKSAFLVYAWKNQLAAVLPSTTPLGWGTLTVTYGGETSAPAPIEVVANAVGIFTRNTAGYGPAIVQNWISPTEIPHLNAFTDAAKPGQVEILWGTGLGAIAGDDSGMPPVGNLNVDVEVLVGGKSAKVNYKGRSYSYPGVDQIQFEVPTGVEGCYVPVAIKANGVIGNHATMAIAPNGGICSSATSYAAADLQKAAQGQPTTMAAANLTRVDISSPFFSGTATMELADANFVRMDANSLLAGLGPLGGNLELPPVSLGACTVHKSRDMEMGISEIVSMTGLDAGAALNLTGPAGLTQIPQDSDETGRYEREIEGGNYFVPGLYTVDNGTGGPDVGPFQATLSIPTSPFQWTNRAGITPSVRRNQPLTVNWSGGDSTNEVVAILGFSADTDRGVSATFVCMANAGAGSFTVPSYLLNELPASSVWAGGEEDPPFGLVVARASRMDRSRFAATGLDLGVLYYVSAHQWFVPFE